MSTRPLTVLHVEAGQHLYGGARQVLYLIEGLRARGVRNVLACPAGSAIAMAATDVADRVAPLAMGGDTDLGLIRRLRRLMRAVRPDVVHLHSRRGADLLGGIAARLEGLPVVLSRRVDNPEPRAWVALKYRLYHRVITISEGIRQVLLGEGVPTHKLVCVRSAVDAAAFRHACDAAWFRNAFDLEENARVLAVIAQLIPRKGHRHLLAALPAILEREPRTRVLLFGQGPLRETLAREIGERGFDGQVRLAGFRDDLPRILPCLDLVVHPADMEGLGVSLMQAAAAGVPIVASRAGGIPEVVRDGDNGLLVPPGDPAALADAVIALLADPDRARAMGEAGHAFAARELSIDAMVEGNLAVYRVLLEGT
ncbi:MAG: glycosyltransferase family 4 protein [Chromatiales bacterium]|nr:glycosyltransferase family 4 protein [Chromatiales bacterium]